MSISVMHRKSARYRCPPTCTNTGRSQMQLRWGLPPAAATDRVGDDDKRVNRRANFGLKARGPQAPKYRDPVSGATWSGRGPAPAWLASAKDRNAHLIEKSASTPINAESIFASKAVKKEHQVGYCEDAER
jgi:hypothetical protein